MMVAVLPSNHPQEGRQQMNSVLSATRSWFSPGHWQAKPSDDATLVPDDPNISAAPRNNGLLIKLSLLDKRISLAIALLITFCSGVAAALAWQSSRQVTPIPQAASAPVAISPALKEQLEAMSSGLAAVRQSVVELSRDLGQTRSDIANLQSTQQALFDKVSEPPPRPAPVPSRPTPRPSQAPPPAR
jgi:hypothetical protein